MQAVRAAGRSSAGDLQQRAQEHADWLQANADSQLAVYARFCAAREDGGGGAASSSGRPETLQRRQRRGGRDERASSADVEEAGRSGRAHSGNSESEDGGEGSGSTAIEIFGRRGAESVELAGAQAGEDPASEVEQRVRSVVRKNSTIASQQASLRLACWSGSGAVEETHCLCMVVLVVMYRATAILSTPCKSHRALPRPAGLRVLHDAIASASALTSTPKTT